MQVIYKDMSLELDKIETEDDVYVTMEDCRQKLKKCTGPQAVDNDYEYMKQLHPKTKKCTASSECKVVIFALGLLLLGASASLCAVGILYHSKVVSNEILRERHDNATAKLMVLKYKATENQTCTLCEEGWKSLGLKCYYFSTHKLNWTQSQDYCVEKGGHLVIITGQTEQDFLVSQIGETHWIGLNDLETEGQWMWVNNQPLKETGVTFWYSAPGRPDEPDNWKEEDPAGENCAALGSEGGHTHKWFDASCHKQKRFICEK
ncbi:C-type lectin domain family 6 member A-like isoform X2 [Hemibagrus wyckioides]|uniref:C-type lectin domain family 6 member A-like isoform X2 n=1 Tax=Hemibagrus wyckioides TaxID=337641 RepID=UPI00266BA500|nr:C-type lectin domain family 6 member A-like isoform X2 [Hemibagrus wyckioides]